MQNIFIITLGTREVQFLETSLKEHGFLFPKNDKGLLTHPELSGVDFQIIRNDNFPESFFCQYPRIAGKIILEHWSLFQDVIEFPLIQNALEIIVRDFPLHHFILVYTDQKDLDISIPQLDKNFKRDTVYLRDIIRKSLVSKFPGLPNQPEQDIPIEERAIDIDFQYSYFAEKCKTLFESEENIRQIFLLAQGGIDQINYALTLQLIQAFGSKVKLWQQAEGEPPNELTFPFLFIEDLNKQKLIEHLENYNFNLIDQNLTSDENVIRLAEYAFTKLNINYTAFPKNIPSKFKGKNNLVTRCKDLYISAKINKKNLDFGNYLWKMFSLLENLYRINCINLLGEKNYYQSKFEDDKVPNTEWLDLLKSIKSDKNNSSLYNHLIAIKGRNGRPLKINNPNRHNYRESFIWFCNNRNDFSVHESTQKLIEKIEELLNPLSYKRNKIAHELEPINIQNLNKIMGAGNIEKLDYLFQKFFDLKSPYGIYDQIKKEIQSQLNI
ncbi:MAG: hypothetical protein ISS19_09610 [Bacteroidales bacterium]|nr:hypothetical protein [Bacteroidales bacterium]